MTIVYAYLIIINAAGFLFMRIDKRKAQKDLWRIPERTLMAIALMGGSIGVLLGMNLFHHKTKQDKFRIGIPIILSVQILLAVFLYIWMQK